MRDSDKRPEVALFATCLIDLVRPDLGFTVVELLECAGYRVTVPTAQTCCGQPNFNGGDRDGAMTAARRSIDVFFDYDYVVIPSGSCGGMVVHHYPQLLADDPVYAARAEALAARVFELSRFLIEVADYRPAAIDPVKLTYHDACAGLRELGVKSEPRELLQRAGAEVVEGIDPEACCGFGGTFCVRYPDISNHMVKRKTDDIQSTGVPLVVAGDLGCLLNIEGKLHRDGIPVAARHFAEVLMGKYEHDSGSSE